MRGRGMAMRERKDGRGVGNTYTPAFLFEHVTIETVASHERLAIITGGGGLFQSRCLPCSGAAHTRYQNGQAHNGAHAAVC